MLSGFDSGGSHQAITAMDTDTQLLHRYVQNRDENAFTALVRLRLGLVYSIALRRVGGDTQLAEDVAQKVFTDLARKASSLSGRTTLTGWLYVSTDHASAAVVRSERRRKNREMEAQTMQTLLDESTTEPDLNRLRKSGVRLCSRAGMRCSVFPNGISNPILGDAWLLNADG